jgi:hypothetical protein
MNKERGKSMKKTIITLACALVAALAFAQTSTTTTEQTTTTSTTGTVATFIPGKTIVMKTETGNLVSYALGNTVRFVNRTGRTIEYPLLKLGARVQVYYDGTDETRVVNRVVIDED